MIRVYQNTRAICRNNSVPFSAVGGTEPYVYEVVAGGAGGSINSSSGLYTAPNKYGRDTIRVTDANDEVGETFVMVCTPLQLLCDIIQVYMGLTKSQVYLWDQKYTVPKDRKLYVAVGELSTKGYGNSSRLNSDGEEEQFACFRTLSTIDIMSADDEAYQRKEELLLALKSQYAERQMNLNAFTVYPITDQFTNISEVDGAAIPYRYTITASLQYFVTKTKPVGYYDTFSNASVETDPELEE